LPSSINSQFPNGRDKLTDCQAVSLAVAGESAFSLNRLVGELPPVSETPFYSSAGCQLQVTGSPAGHFGSYLDYEATSPSTLKLAHIKGRMCGSSALIGTDEDGNRIAKRIICGREWCSQCREASHKRRMARIFPRVFEYDFIAYVVITFDLEIRKLMHNPQVLSSLARKARRTLKKMGYTKIYTRWHFYGDKNPGVYNPHLNVLIDGGLLSREALEHLKSELRRALVPRAIRQSIKNELVIKYQFTRDAGRKVHWIKYITKATFLNEGWDERLAAHLYEFHNGCFSGTFNGQKKWRLTGTDKKYNCLIKLSQGLHPVSGKLITWARKPIPWVLVLMEEPVEISGGWYVLPPIRPSPVRVDDG